MNTLPHLDDVLHALVTQIKDLVSVACDVFDYKDGAFSTRITPHMDALQALRVLFTSDTISPAEDAAFRYAHSIVIRIYTWLPVEGDGQFFRLFMEGLLVLQSLTLIFAEDSAGLAN